MSEQPEALRLAQQLENARWADVQREEAAAELRRLHADVEALRAQRDALMEALRFYAANMGRRTSDNEPFFMTAIEYDCGDRARAAIAKAEGRE